MLTDPTTQESLQLVCSHVNHWMEHFLLLDMTQEADGSCIPNLTLDEMQGLYSMTRTPSPSSRKVTSCDDPEQSYPSDATPDLGLIPDHVP